MTRTTKATTPENLLRMIDHRLLQLDRMSKNIEAQLVHIRNDLKAVTDDRDSIEGERHALWVILKENGRFDPKTGRLAPRDPMDDPEAFDEEERNPADFDDHIPF